MTVGIPSYAAGGYTTGTSQSQIEVMLEFPRHAWESHVGAVAILGLSLGKGSLGLVDDLLSKCRWVLDSDVEAIQATYYDSAFTFVEAA